MHSNFEFKAAFRVRFGEYNPEDRESSCKKENFTHRALSYRWPTQLGEWADHDVHFSEHINTLKVPEHFHGKQICVFVEVISQCGIWKRGWCWEGVSCFINAPNHDFMQVNEVDEADWIK